MPSVFTFSRICQSGLSSRAAQSACVDGIRGNFDGTFTDGPEGTDLNGTYEGSFALQQHIGEGQRLLLNVRENLRAQVEYHSLTYPGRKPRLKIYRDGIDQAERRDNHGQHDDNIEPAWDYATVYNKPERTAAAPVASGTAWHTGGSS